MSETELDRMMQRVLIDALKLEWEAELEKENTFEQSARHQCQIRAMLADPVKWAKKRSRPIWKRVAQQVAVVLLVISMSLGGVMVVSPNARAAVIRWVTEWYETHITYRYFGDDIEGQMPCYGISNLPEGYVEKERLEQTATVSVMYANDEGDMVFLDYAFMQQGGATVFSDEGYSMFDVTINDMAGQLFLPENADNAKAVTWIHEENNIQFVLRAFCSENDIVNMAEAVSLAKTPNY